MFVFNKDLKKQPTFRIMLKGTKAKYFITLKRSERRRERKGGRERLK